MSSPSSSSSSSSRRDLLLASLSRNEKAACWYTKVGRDYFYQGRYVEATKSFSDALSAFKNRQQQEVQLSHNHHQHQHHHHRADDDDVNGTCDDRMSTAVSSNDHQSSSSGDDHDDHDDVSIPTCPSSPLEPIDPFQPNITGSFQHHDDDPTEEIRLVVIGLVLVLNLAICNHVRALKKTESKGCTHDDDDDDEEEDMAIIWKPTLQLYHCTGQFLNHLLKVTQDLCCGRDDDDDDHDDHDDLTTGRRRRRRTRRKKAEEEGIKFHRWMRLITVHNMATIYERFPTAAAAASASSDGATITSHELYQHLFSYVVNMNYIERNIISSSTAAAEHEEHRRHTALPDGFPLEWIMESVIRGLNILTNAVTAPAA
jgi:hypothetical protein